MKQPTIYLIIIGAWLTLICVFSLDLLHPLTQAAQVNLATYITMYISTLFIIYFWLNGLKDVVYTVFYYLFYRQSPSIRTVHQPHVDVVMVYCTCNDFNPESLRLSLDQDYPNVKTVILDDSTKDAYKEQIDRFASIFNIEVIRRVDRNGFKAGNLNNYLQTSKADYFVILDSDEVIPNDFISKALPYFIDERIAIVQGNHIATGDRNTFMEFFSAGVESHWNTYQTIKDRYGFLSFLGHGAMIRKSAYDQVGGFPYLVAEDLCFSIELRNKGYYVRFAPEIICKEEYPVSFMAFKKRHAKWTMGNMEFVKRYTSRVFSSSMHWYEKLDIVLFTYSLPLTFMFITYLLINIVILPLLHFQPHYSVFMLIPTVVFLLAPMLNDAVYFLSKGSKGYTLMYLLGSMMLYGSMFFVSFKASLKALFGKAEFIVTPKEDTVVSLWNAFLFNLQEIAFGAILAVTSISLSGSILPVVLIIVPSLWSIRLTLMSNKSTEFMSIIEIAEVI